MAQTRRRKWSADVTEHSDAMDLENEVFKQKSSGEDCEITQALGGAQRPAEIQSLSLGNVDAELLYKSRTR